MPFTVSCAACESRFLLGDDLFRRKVSGKLVTVKCRTCNAEISVDATEPATLPSQDPPRRPHPAPPRPKHKEGETITATPLPTPTSLPVAGAAQHNGDQPRRKPPVPHSADGGFIEDVEEIPPSSSDAPSLGSLTHESPVPVQALAQKAPDDFLLNLSASMSGFSGVPTIDVAELTALPPAAVEELLQVEATELTPPAGTNPLFDVSALSPTNDTPKSTSSSLAPSHLDLGVDVETPSAPGDGGGKRARKHGLAPLAEGEPSVPKTPLLGTAVWFSLVAAAAGILVVIGIRGHSDAHRAVLEPPPAEHQTSSAESAAHEGLAPAPVLAATPESSAAPSTANAKGPSSTAPVAPGNPNATAATLTPARVKTGELAKPAAPENTEATSALEKPAEAEKPAQAEGPSVQTPSAAPEPAEPGTEFDRSAAVAALRSAAADAAACRKDGDPSGTASLTIIFAPSGRVTSANIQGPPFAGTVTGGCIANAMRHAHVPAFSGDRVTVTKTITVE